MSKIGRSLSISRAVPAYFKTFNCPILILISISGVRQRRNVSKSVKLQPSTFCRCSCSSNLLRRPAAGVMVVVGFHPLPPWVRPQPPPPLPHPRLRHQVCKLIQYLCVFSWYHCPLIGSISVVVSCCFWQYRRHIIVE